jgi:hypothetical protein
MYKEHEGKTMTTADVNFCWMRSSLLASVDVIEFHTTEAYSNLDRTKVKYNTYKHSFLYRSSNGLNKNQVRRV